MVIVAAAAAFAWLSSPPPPPRVLNTTQLTRDGIPKADVVTDGSRLYINEGQILTHIVQASAAGGETSPLPTPFANAIAAEISPDHTATLGGSASWAPRRKVRPGVCPFPSGAPRRLADVVGHGATWSPDGRHFVFFKASDIYQANADGTDPKKLITVSGTPRIRRFSPDGTRIRFTLTVPENNSGSLWEIRSDGSDLHPLLPGWHNPPSECCGVVDARWPLLSLCEPSPSRGNIWAMREPTGLFHRRSSGPFQLTAGPLSFDLSDAQPGWQESLCQARRKVAENSSATIPSLLSSCLSYRGSRRANWISPATASGSLTFPIPSKRSGAAAWTAAIACSSPFRQSSPACPAGLPTVPRSPISTAQPGRPWKAFLISTQGGTPQEMLSETHTQADATWSPDGKRLALGRTRKLDCRNHSDPDRGPRDSPALSHPRLGELFSPRWSPDGQYLAAITA